MTDTPNLMLAPGCFGMAMTYKPTARECSACPFASACAPKAVQSLTALRDKLGIKLPPPKTIIEKMVAKTVKNAEALIDEATPKKVVAHLERLERIGLKLTPSLIRGENPVKPEHKQAFLRIACHLLLTQREGFSREALVACFKSRLEHAPKTAEAHAKMAVQILEAVGAAQEANGVIKRRGNV